jgi:hypothetical protein
LSRDGTGGAGWAVCWTGWSGGLGVGVAVVGCGGGTRSAVSDDPSCKKGDTVSRYDQRQRYATYIIRKKVEN